MFQDYINLLKFLFSSGAPRLTLDAQFSQSVLLKVLPLTLNQVSVAVVQYTHSGKKVEIAVKKILNGEDVKVRSAYVNPDSLDLYYNIPELRNY